MWDNTITQIRAAEHQKDLQEEGAKARMLQAVKPARPSLQERILVYLGDLLICTGIWLHRLYRPTEHQPCHLVFERK